MWISEPQMDDDTTLIFTPSVFGTGTSNNTGLLSMTLIAFMLDLFTSRFFDTHIKSYEKY
jgi:hypothetical protein